ncbi:LysR family transcriptional regulator [Marinobacterium arenosum]|uniref:LysR family transcriptional regulator n=1 Tax=Marinobacterium arenosum TaxID=2862496 RepID=UPI001C984CD1|nr:LysR family transcriptional regulator [Marinobacterium arenosum]MBY4678091.1 LysR family transcriptional regulator [Marinobacterium arenosum]
MEIRQLRYFLAVQESGSFTQAAKQLYVTQPALSAAIKALEEELGCALLKRQPKRVTLTPAGLRFRDRAFSILAEVNAARKELSQQADLRSLRIGVLGTLNVPPVKQLLAEFAATYPEIELQLQNSSLDGLAQLLGQDKVDLLLTTLTGDERSDTSLPLFQERYLMLVSRQHPLATRASVHLADLHGIPFVLRKNCEVLSEAQRVFLTEQAQPHISCRTDQDDWALTMIRAGRAAGIMAESVDSPDLVKIPIVDFGLLRTVGCQWRSHSSQPCVQQFTTFAAQYDWRRSIR